MCEVRAGDPNDSCAEQRCRRHQDAEAGLLKRVESRGAVFGASGCGHTDNISLPVDSCRQHDGRTEGFMMC